MPEQHTEADQLDRIAANEAKHGIRTGRAVCATLPQVAPRSIDSHRTVCRASGAADLVTGAPAPQRA